LMLLEVMIALRILDLRRIGIKTKKTDKRE
jgi:hypothetical protein